MTRQITFVEQRLYFKKICTQERIARRHKIIGRLSSSAAAKQKARLALCDLLGAEKLLFMMFGMISVIFAYSLYTHITKKGARKSRPKFFASPINFLNKLGKANTTWRRRISLRSNISCKRQIKLPNFLVRSWAKCAFLFY